MRWAQPGRLIRQLLTESAALTLLGVLAALPLSSRGAHALVTWAAADEKWRLSLQNNWRVLAFTAAVALLATCLFGVAPAFAATRIDVHAALQGSRRGITGGVSSRALGQSLVVAQLAISLTLLSGAALLTRSLWNLRHQDFGFQRDGTLILDLPLEFNRAMMAFRHWQPSLRPPERLARRALRCRLRLRANGRDAAHCESRDLARQAQRGDFTRVVHVSPRYFETMRIPLLAGRPIGKDRAGAPRVAVISESAARALFGAMDPLGRTFSEARKYDSRQTVEVIGVARDVRFGNPREPFGFILYVPLEQEPAPVTAAILHPIANPSGVAAAARAAVHDIDSSVMIGAIRPLAEIIDSKLGNDQLLSALALCFGALSLGMVAVGVYGVLSYAVQRRTQEIGIRLALGAARGAVASLLMRDVGRLLCAGVLCGGAGAFVAVRALRTLIFAFTPADYALLAAAAALLVLIAVLAAWVPARRAARLNPIDALR